MDVSEFPFPTEYQVMIRVNCHLSEQQATDLTALPDPQITIRSQDSESTLLAARITAPQMSDAIAILHAVAQSVLPGATVSNGQAVALTTLPQAS